MSLNDIKRSLGVTNTVFELPCHRELGLLPVAVYLSCPEGDVTNLSCDKSHGHQYLLILSNKSSDFNYRTSLYMSRINIFKLRYLLCEINM